MVLGTAGYMSPEQVRGEGVDHRSDLFSFGVVLYEMLCGKRAFTGDSSVEVMNAILKDDPPELPASVPPALGRIVRRCLEKDPDRRFQSTADLGFALPAIVALPAASGGAHTQAQPEMGRIGGVRRGLGIGVCLAQPSAAPAANHRHCPNHKRRPGKRAADAHRRLPTVFQPGVI